MVVCCNLIEKRKTSFGLGYDLGHSQFQYNNKIIQPVLGSEMNIWITNKRTHDIWIGFGNWLKQNKSENEQIKKNCKQNFFLSHT